jgi:chemotaxis protein methyltransferase CheR
MDASIDYVRRLMREATGVSLGAEKAYLVRSALAPIANRVAKGSLSRLVGMLMVEREAELGREVVEALLNHETWFYRDLHPFSALKEVIAKEGAARASRPLRIWSAACSTGQEPYSVAMTVRAALPQGQQNVEILASDVSEPMLIRARQGLYTLAEVNRGLPAEMLLQHFSEEGPLWRLDEQTREQVEFRRIDLMETLPSLPTMDIVLLRNVLIYFDEADRQVVLDRVRKVVRPGGYLLLGSSEMIRGTSPGWVRERGADSPFYRAALPTAYRHSV